ncbi:hypothetical protein [Gordonia terrae]|uniref:hypothetical protein n=1 Tax=Gordonia terrae TaxID=2055 RepID=UPI003FEF40A8
MGFDVAANAYDRFMGRDHRDPGDRHAPGFRRMVGVRTSPASGRCGIETRCGSRPDPRPGRRAISRATRAAPCRSPSTTPISSSTGTRRITEPDVVAELAELWSSDGWPCRVDESGIALTADFSAPSAGPPPWHVYRVAPRRATVLQTVEPGGATLFEFDER